MVERSRSTFQRREIVQRIENLVIHVVTSWMPGHDRVLKQDLDTIDVTFDRHRLKRTLPGDAVVHLVEPHKLVLIDLSHLADAGIKPMPRQCRCLLLVTCESTADRLRLSAARASLFSQAALPEISVQFVVILNSRNRRRPFALQRLDTVLHHRLLVPFRR